MKAVSGPIEAVESIAVALGSASVHDRHAHWRRIPPAQRLFIESQPEAAGSIRPVGSRFTLTGSRYDYVVF